MEHSFEGFEQNLDLAFPAECGSDTLGGDGGAIGGFIGMAEQSPELLGPLFNGGLFDDGGGGFIDDAGEGGIGTGDEGYAVAHGFEHDRMDFAVAFGEQQCIALRDEGVDGHDGGKR